MPKQSSGSSRNFNERPIDDDANNFEALKARVGTTVNIFTLIFALIAVLAPSSVYIYELLYSEEPPTVWWLETVIETDLKDLTISVVDKDTLPTIQTSNKDTEWVKSNLRISRRWSEGTYCGSDRSLARHSTGNSTNTKHRKSAVSHSTGFIFDAMYTDYRAYVSILLKDNTQSLCDTRAVITDSSSSSSSSTSSTYNDSMYANRTWLHVPKVYPKAFICRFYDHKSKLMASSSSQSVIAGYYVRCPVPTQVRSRHKLLMRLQWYEDAPIVSDSGKARYMRSRNQSSVAGSSASVGFKRESKMASHFSHLFPVCSFLSAEYHTGRSLTASGIAVGSDGSTLSSSVAVDTSIGTTNSTGFSSRLSQFSPFRNHSKSTAVTVDSDKDLISQYNVSVCTSVGLGVLGYTNTDRHHLLEWLEYHRVLGAEHFFMYDLARYSTNKNASGTSSSSNRPLNLSLKEILAPYISTGVVTLIPWQEPSCQSARTGGTSDDVDDVCDQSDVDASSESLPADYESVFKNEIERYRHTGGASVDININVKGSKADRTEYKTDNIVSSSTLSKSDRRRKRADRLQVRAMQSCYLRHRESSRWMTFLSSDEFIGVNSHHRMRDGSKLHSLVEMLEDDIEENPHTVAVKLPVASYFPCKTSEASTLSELGLDTVRQGSEGTAQEIANSYNSQATAIVLPLRIDSHVHTVPTINHTPLTGRQRKYAGIKYVNTRVAFVRTDSVLFWSPRDDSHLFAYLSNRKISIPRTDTNVTDSKNKKKWRNSAAASESIEGLMSYSLRLTHLEPHSDTYVHVVRRVDPDIAQFMSFRSSIEVSSCQEEREIVKLADIVRVPSSSMPVVNSTDVSATSSVPSLQSIVTSVWEQNVCKAKEVETQSRYSQTERSALVTDRVAAALSGFIMPPYQYNHQNDRL